MSLASLWTLNQLRTAVRLELLDPTGKWWTDVELNQYLNDWQDILQSQFEFIWSTATITFTDTTTEFAWQTIAPNMLRPDAVYYQQGNPLGGTQTSIGRLSPRSLADLDTLQRNWRGTAAAAGIDPIIVYQNNASVINFWPPPAGTGTAYFEYPVITTMTQTTSGTSVIDGTMSVPAWTKYSAIPYCCYRAYAKFSSNQDLNKAKRRRMQWDRWLKQIRWIYDGYFPDKAGTLRPGRKWAGQILGTKPSWPVWR